MGSSRLEIEIGGQGEVVRRWADGDAASCLDAARLIRSSRHLVVAARGSSANAARFAQYLLCERARLLVGLADPSLYREPESAPDLGSAAVLAISQSGQSPDVVAVLGAARAQGRPAIALTNDPGSPLARQADLVVPMLAGEERSVAATGTYTASLVALAQLADALAPGAGGATPDRLARLADALDALVERELAERERYDALDASATLTIVGRGLHSAGAHETALKLRELSGTPAEAFSSADLMHGPIAAIGERTAVWIVRPGHGASAVPVELARRLRGRAGALVTVGAEAVGAPLDADIAVSLPELPGWAAAILAVVPGQVAALRLAELRGVEPDAPHGLRKVTLTT